MSNDSHAAIALALGAGTGLGLWYLLRDDALPASAPPEAATSASAAPPCALRLDAKGLTADGAVIDVPTAIATCKAAGKADLVLADDAPSAAYADLSAAFGAAGILIQQRRNARRQTRPPRYLAWCGTCYSGARLETNSRREANVHATSHLRLYPGHAVHVTDRATPRARDERNVRGRSDRELAALAVLAAQLVGAPTVRQGSKHREVAARLARFVATHSGARIEDHATLDFEDNVVVSGAPEEMRKVAAWVERLARDTGRAISATVETFDDPEDQDWAVCRIRGL